MAQSKFWMVLGDNVPKHRHETRPLAVKEAERLARMCPGKEFFILEAVAVCVKSDIAWTKLESDPIDDVDEIPF